MSAFKGFVCFLLILIPCGWSEENVDQRLIDHAHLRAEAYIAQYNEKYNKPFVGVIDTGVDGYDPSQFSKGDIVPLDFKFVKIRTKVRSWKLKSVDYIEEKQVNVFIFSCILLQNREESVRSFESAFIYNVFDTFQAIGSNNYNYLPEFSPPTLEGLTWGEIRKMWVSANQEGEMEWEMSLLLNSFDFDIVIPLPSSRNE